MSFYADVKKILKDLGFEFHRHGKGSHEIWRNPTTGVSVSVPSNLKSRHTANNILKDAGSNIKF
ncbi:type II toxin-antitoxin system HicA family toxin [Burkholderia pyrrocinia]|uniref:type II toxin-antitoxin system HicA family toxin n=1 Tax=Burkholderia cepacia complex TaxID=87882 RepID=UPI00075E84DF|nr:MULTISPECIES: type II toxin-antitoxin system HicA family toxin [Burkholderia cepacia complex]KWN75271.1 hypothetical protein WM23_25895 [Burkholderia ubonensis]UVE64765.1 type II toxin-antitoxin system HicA family toxin [Burkholderia pyrrocinia]